jgi:hypothetical protein
MAEPMENLPLAGPMAEPMEKVLPLAELVPVPVAGPVAELVPGQAGPMEKLPMVEQAELVAGSGALALPFVVLYPILQIAVA